MYLYKSFKFELYPDANQKQKIKQFCGLTRFIMNHASVWEQLRENSRNLRFNAQDAIKLLAILEKSSSWLANCPPQILQEVLKDLEKSFKKFYKYGCYPNFKKKGTKDSFRIKEDFSIDEFNNRIYLPILGWIKYRNDRKISGTVKNVNLFFKNQRFFISILTSNNHIYSMKKEDNFIGTDLSDKYSPIYIKNLKIGDIAQSVQIIFKTNQKILPNKKELNNAIMDQTWREFRKILRYKLLWQEGNTIVVSTVNTSRKCPICRNISILNCKIRNQFESYYCIYKNQVDIVSTINIVSRDQVISRRQYVN